MIQAKKHAPIPVGLHGRVMNKLVIRRLFRNCRFCDTHRVCGGGVNTREPVRGQAVVGLCDRVQTVDLCNRISSESLNSVKQYEVPGAPFRNIERTFRTARWLMSGFHRRLCAASVACTFTRLQDTNAAAILDNLIAEKKTVPMIFGYTGRSCFKYVTTAHGAEYYGSRQVHCRLSRHCGPMRR